MPVITPTTVNILNDVVVTIDGDSYEPAVSSVSITATNSLVRYKGMTPGAVYTKVTASEFSFDLTAAADWDDAASLANRLWEGAGEEVTMSFQPKAGGATFTGTVVLVEPSVGGAIDGIETFTVSLGVIGKPVRTLPTP
jgi:hypothetical protein